MNRFFLYLSYNGGGYCGWQRQPNGISIQQVVEEALATILRTPTPITGAGRTDAGVHALMMTAHCDMALSFDEASCFAGKLNSLLPKDIAINKIVPVRPSAHARFDALSRTYKYFITDVKNPFNHEWVCRMSLKDMDFPLMNMAASMLLDYSDFTSFSKLHTDVKTNDCQIFSAGWKRESDLWVFEISANRFLRNMVRAVVGTLFEVGRGKRSIEDFRQTIEAKDRRLAGSSADAHGLSLASVEYPEEVFRI